MITDKEIFRQMLERDFLQIYDNVPILLNNLGVNIAPYLSLIDNKVMSYADQGIEYILNILFGDPPGDADEALDIAKLMVNDKIEQYRAQIREQKVGKSDE